MEFFIKTFDIINQTEKLIVIHLLHQFQFYRFIMNDNVMVDDDDVWKQWRYW